MTTQRDRPRDEGMSVTELLITMVIFGIIVAATATMSIGFMRANAQTISRQDQIDEARAAVEAITRSMRTAVMPNQLADACTPACDQDAFITGQDFAVVFYANIDNPGNSVGPSRVTYSVATTGANKGTLVQVVQVPDPQVGTATNYVYCDTTAPSATAQCKARATTRTLARGVQVVTGKPVFAYFDASGTALVPPAGGSLPLTDLSRVLSVDLVVSVQAQNASRARPTTYIGHITLPNAQSVPQNVEPTP